MCSQINAKLSLIAVQCLNKKVISQLAQVAFKTNQQTLLLISKINRFANLLKATSVGGH